MSQLLDELARTLAKPMPRSRVVRVLGGSIAAAAFPFSRPAGAATLHGSSCGAPGTCPPKTTVCGCDFLAGCYRDCCTADQICCKWPRPSGPGRPPCEKICCPAGTRCGSGEPGDVCVPLCPTRCGEKCCQKGEYCADQRRSLCCKDGDSECRIFPPPGRPATGKEPAQCCPKELPKCCANDKKMACCEAAGTCCAGGCCPPDKVCTKGVCACPKGTTTCGRRCCTKTETCCPDKAACCAKGQTCCGKDCCEKTEKCCPGPDKHCCKDKEICCGPNCCSPDQVCASHLGSKKCCGKGRAYQAGKQLFCCPVGTVPSQGGCCPPAIPDCCVGDEDHPAPLPVPGKVCVSGGLVKI
jgi:hypothetical protein